MERKSLSFTFVLGSLYIVKLALTVLQNQSGSGAATIINNKILSSEVCLSDPMRLIRKFAFLLFPFYPIQFRFLDETPLGEILEKAC